MYNKGYIIPGLVVFVLLFASPVLINVGKTATAPEPKLNTPVIEELETKACVRSNMQLSHMQLLNLWRGSVVRDGNRTAVGDNGQLFEMSLSNTCMECHSNKVDFCDKCHTYAGVAPYCWDCHVEPPKEGQSNG